MGWMTNLQNARQARAWEKSRSAVIEKIGVDLIKNDSAVKNRAREVFKEIDTDGNGQIDDAEQNSAMEKMGVTLTKKELDDMMTEADEDGDHLIDIDEFVALISAEVKRYNRARSKFCVVM